MERNYHIFYAMLAGVTAEERGEEVWGDVMREGLEGCDDRGLVRREGVGDVMREVRRVRCWGKVHVCLRVGGGIRSTYICMHTHITQSCFNSENLSRSTI